MGGITREQAAKLIPSLSVEGVRRLERKGQIRRVGQGPNRVALLSAEDVNRLAQERGVKARAEMNEAEQDEHDTRIAAFEALQREREAEESKEITAYYDRLEREFEQQALERRMKREAEEQLRQTTLTGCQARELLQLRTFEFRKLVRTGILLEIGFNRFDRAAVMALRDGPADENAEESAPVEEPTPVEQPVKPSLMAKLRAMYERSSERAAT